LHADVRDKVRASRGFSAFWWVSGLWGEGRGPVITSLQRQAGRQHSSRARCKTFPHFTPQHRRRTTPLTYLLTYLCSRFSDRKLI